MADQSYRRPSRPFVAAGARPAESGEFTRRAVLNGKLDLLQAEAIGDLVDASTRPAQRVALAQMDGGLSRRIEALRENILQLEALAAYDIDFPEEDDGPIPSARILSATASIIADLDRLLATAPVGELVRQGAVVVIAGAPNVGKSSLFNALLGRRRAIVTEVPGTTRDALEAVTEAESWPIRLIDTAGLRDATELVERLGIEVSREYLELADVVLVCGDSRATLAEAVRAISEISSAPRSPGAHQVRSRVPGGACREPRRRDLGEHGDRRGPARRGTCDRGRAPELQGRAVLDAPLVTRERHHVALVRARDELRQFGDVWAKQTGPVRCRRRAST